MEVLTIVPFGSGGGGGDASVAGSDTEIQYNDNAPDNDTRPVIRAFFSDGIH